MATPAHIRCPACQGPLAPTELHCLACDLSIRGSFATNEFASLGEEDLHFLRIFILCEGRIRDMESALGVSYPSIKSRMAQLKATLSKAASAARAAPPLNPAPNNASADRATAILRELQAGRLTFEAAMGELKKDATS